MDANEQNTNATPNTEANVVPEQNTAPAAPAAPKFDPNDPEIKMLLQKEGDRRVTAIQNELKAAREAMEELKKQNMTDGQRKEYERQQMEQKALEEKNLLQNQLRTYMAKAELGKRGWPDELMAHVLGDSEDEVKQKADALAILVDKLAETRIGTHLNNTGIKPAATNVSTTATNAVDMTDPNAVYEAVKAGKLKMFTTQP